MTDKTKRAPIAVGSRVRLRGYSAGGVCVDGLRAEVVERLFNGNLVVKLDKEPLRYTVTHSQCRRFAPRAPRREIFVKYALDGSGRVAAYSFIAKPAEFDFDSGWVRFVEARPSTRKGGKG